MLNYRQLFVHFARDALHPQSSVRSLFLTQNKLREVEDRKIMLKSAGTKDEGTAGEKLLDIDTMITQQVSTCLWLKSTCT